MNATTSNGGNHHLQQNLSEADLFQALERLIVRSNASGRKEYSQVHADVQTICQYADHNGLPASVLQQLLDLLTQPTPFPEAIPLRLVESLYPASWVSSDLICTIVAALGHGKRKPAAALQNALLKWLIMIYDVLEDSTILSQLYGVLFDMLDILVIRTHLCYLLAYITRRKHVKPFRVQALQDFFHEADRNLAVNCLLQVFNIYCPEGSFNKTSEGLVKYIPLPDKTWRDRLRIIQDARGLHSRGTGIEYSSCRMIHTSVKRRTLSNGFNNLERLEQETFISLDTVDSVQDFVGNIEKINISYHMLSAIDDHYLRKYAPIIPRSDYMLWLDKSLESCFEELAQKADQEVSTRKVTDTLEQVLRFTRYMKILPISVEAFLKEYLVRWNGKENRDIILALLSYITARPFKELQNSHFDLLETALLDNSASSSIALLDFYTSLLQRWTSHLFSAPLDPTDTQIDKSIFTGKMYPPRVFDTNIPALTSAITSLTTHTSLLTLALLTTHGSAPQILSYLETVSSLISEAHSYPTLTISVPHPLTIYLLTFCYPSISTLSRLCSVLATHKIAFEAILTRPRVSPGSTDQPQGGTSHKYSVTHFNGFLMDICNLLWRSRAFNRTDANALGCLLPPAILPHLAAYTSSLKPPYLLNTSFSLSFHSDLAGLSNATMREIEDAEIAAHGKKTLEKNLESNFEGDGQVEREVRVRHAGPVTQKSLLVLGREGGVVVGWKDYRLAVLTYLKKRGMTGLAEFMGCTMKGLMGKGEGGNAV